MGASKNATIALLATAVSHCNRLSRISGSTVLAATLVLSFFSLPSHAAVITFDDAVAGETTFGFDGDGDGLDDVIFSTTDPSGFNTTGPGANQSFIDEPGLEGTTTLNPDLRVDFVFGAVNSLSFGFAMSLDAGSIDGVTFTIFDAADNTLATTSVLADFTFPDGVNPSSFPEGFVNLGFTGIASYATFDFSNNLASRYIIDNFEGTFGSTEDIVPVSEPMSVALLSFALLVVMAVTRKAARFRIRSNGY